MSYNMSYNTNNSISTCSNFENQEDIYAFDIKIINFNDEIVRKKIISLDKIGELLECENNIKKIKITFCLLNSNLSETVIFKKHFINEINETIILFKKNVFIYLRNINQRLSTGFNNNNNQRLIINYKIN
jgi:hypothetical protein